LYSRKANCCLHHLRRQRQLRRREDVHDITITSVLLQLPNYITVIDKPRSRCNSTDNAATFFTTSVYTGDHNVTIELRFHVLPDSK